MKVSIMAQEYEDGAPIDAFVRHEITAALERFSDEIVSVDVFMKDTNGPKGGLDKQVLLRVRMRGGRQFALHTTKDNLYAATRVSAKRARRAVKRSLGKAQRIEKLSLKKPVGRAPGGEVLQS